MKSEAFDDWLSLFDQDMERVWLSEREELRRAAMIYHCLNFELKRIQTVVEDQMSVFKLQLIQMDNKHKTIQSPPVTPIKQKSAQGCQKENTSPNIDVTLTQKQKVIESPSMILDDSSSPDVMRFMSRRSSPSISTISSLSLGGKLNSGITELDLSNEVINESAFGSPTIDRSRLSRLKKISSPSLLNVSINSKSATTPPNSGYTNLQINFKTPRDVKRRNSDLFDSFIESTPEVRQSQKKARTSKMALKSTKKVKPSKSKQTSTLTQLFGSQRRANVSARTPDILDGDTTFFDDALLPKQDMMHIDDIIDNVNKESCKVVQQISAVSVNESNKSKPLKVISSFAADYDRFPERSQKEQVNYKYKMATVRGKERQKLEGWDCAECNKFYEAMGLTNEQKKAALNRCSRHRNKFAPMNETPVGYWDVNTMSSTQDSEEF